MARRRHKKKPLPARIGEGATVERCHHQDGVVREIMDRDAGGGVLTVRSRARSECMLDSYAIRRLIAFRLHKTGMRCRMAWERAREGIAVTDRFGSGAPVSYEESLYGLSESERILKEAHEELSSAQWLVVARVCYDNKPAGGTDKIETLRRGLNRLADFWKITVDESDPELVFLKALFS